MRLNTMWSITSGYEKSGVRLAWLGCKDLVSVLLHSGSGLVPAVSGMANWLANEILLCPSFSWWFPPYPPISLFLVLNSTITQEYKVKSSLSITPWYDQELALSTAFTEYSIHRVQYTPSTAYTEYCIHCVLHTPRTAYTGYCIISKSTVSRSQPLSHLSADHGVLNSLHSHNHEVTKD